MRRWRSESPETRSLHKVSLEPRIRAKIRAIAQERGYVAEMQRDWLRLQAMRESDDLIQLYHKWTIRLRRIVIEASEQCQLRSIREVLNEVMLSLLTP
jgi:hypothetical protein